MHIASVHLQCSKFSPCAFTTSLVPKLFPHVLKKLNLQIYMRQICGNEAILLSLLQFQALLVGCLDNSMSVGVTKRLQKIKIILAPFNWFLFLSYNNCTVTFEREIKWSDMIVTYICVHLSIVYLERAHGQL